MRKDNHIIKMAIYKVRKDKLKIVLPAVKEFVKAVNKKERGRTLMYSAFQKKGAPHELVHIMIFKDKKAEKAHKKSPHARKFVELISPNSTSEPVFIDMNRLL